MSTQPISGAGGLSSTNGLLQITGLASGLDTNALIQALLAVDRQPVSRLTTQQQGLKALNSQLTSIQSALQTLALNAQSLGDATLFTPTQTVSSTNPSVVSATAPSGVGAVVGGYQVAVSQLATSAQRTFTFASPGSADTLTIDGHQTAVAAGATVQDVVNAINSDSNATVWATSTNSSTVVLSSRATGNNGASFIQVSDPGNTLVEQAALAQQGQNAQYTINGTSGSSTSNTLTAAIPGVTLTLNGVTTGGSPIGITVGAPAPNPASVQAAVKSFVDSYNSMIDQINSQLSEKTVSDDPTKGVLFGDQELTALLTDMRQAMYTPGAGLPTGMASLADIGITTGAASGSGTFSQSSVDGHLTIDSTALANALASNPNGVKQVLQSWSQSFSKIVNDEAAPGGGIDARIQGDNSEISDIGDQISNLNSILADRQTALQQQFANLEGLLSQSQAQSNWLAGQINSLPLP